VQVTRAILAPGYIGMYLVEIEVPNIVNYGPAELYIETDGQPSNRVRVYIEPQCVLLLSSSLFPSPA